MRILNAELTFSSLSPQDRNSFLGQAAAKVCFLPNAEFFKFTGKPLINDKGYVSPFWSGVQPLTPNDVGLVGLLERADAMGVTPQSLVRSQSAVSWHWNALSALQTMKLNCPVWGFVGRCANQPWDATPEMQKVRWIGGAWQAFLPNLESQHVEAVSRVVLGPPWKVVAESQIGVHEVALKGKHNAQILAYHATTTLAAKQDEVPWCSSFVNWVFSQADIVGTKNALASSWLEWGQAVSKPQFGAVTVIKHKVNDGQNATGSRSGFHVGFYVNSPPGAIRLLGGNQSDQVKYSDFPLAKYEIKAFRWPGR